MPGPSRTNSWWSHRKDLYTLLDRFKESEATDERDMIYALLGMSSGRENHGLLADYTKPGDLVIHEACCYLFGTRATNVGLTSTMSNFLSNFTSLNAKKFVELAPSWTVEDADIFLAERAGKIPITDAMLEAVALNLQHGKEITELLVNRVREDRTESEKTPPRDFKANLTE